MKTIGVLLFGILLFSANLAAQAFQYTHHIDSPINEVLNSGCSEAIAVSGFVHGVIHLTRSDEDQSIMSESHVGPRGDMHAIGMETGQQFKVVGQTFTRVFFGQNILQLFSYHNTFKVVGLYTVHYTYHLLFGDNHNEPKAFVDNLRVTCN